MKHNSNLVLSRMNNDITGTGCSFTVEGGSSLLLEDPVNDMPWYLSNGAVENGSLAAYLDISGILEVTNLKVEQEASVFIRSGGHLKADTIHMRTSSSLLVEDGGNVGTTGINLKELYLGPDVIMTVMVETLTLNCDVLTMDWSSQITSTHLPKRIQISVASMVMREQSLIDCKGGGNLQGLGYISGAGGTYGGQGGLSTSDVYEPYNYPVDYGSGSGSVRGGGQIRITASEKLHIDGLLDVEGGEADNLPGGSGGSLLLEAPILSGRGLLSVSGGNADNDTAGGGGGRIAIHADNIINFFGTLTAFGGLGKWPGAAGTIYKQYKDVTSSTRKDVIVDNNGFRSQSRTHLLNPDEIQLYLQGMAFVTFASNTASEFVMEQIYGDNSGTVFVTSGQKVSLSTTFGVQHPYLLPCKLNVEQGGEIHLPQKVIFTDSSSDVADEPNLILHGQIGNVKDLVVGENGHVVVSGTANMAGGAPGQIFFNRLDVVSGGLLQIGIETVSQFELRGLLRLVFHFDSHTQGKNLKLEAPDIIVAYKARVEVDGNGYISGPGVGSTVTDAGSGGSHGGAGGLNNDVLLTGSIYTATDFGSGGGNGTESNGGAGGGSLFLTSSKHILINGIVSSNGAGSSSNGGGGGGGSVWVHSEALTGDGLIMAAGGNSDAGGGGGGGRIRVHVTEDYNFLDAHYHLSGGLSNTSISGGSGIAYITIIRNNAPYNIMIIDNSDIGEAEAAYTYLNESSTSDITLSEFRTKSASHFYLAGYEMHLTIEKLFCTQESTIHVPDGAILEVDTSQAETNIHCSLRIEAQAEVRLPQVVTFLGPDNLFAGKSFFNIN